MTWEIDPTHSHVSFAIRVMSVSTTRGRFNVLRGRLHIDEQHPANSWVDAQVEAASIDTHNKLRDAHLRSAAFFDVKKYSTITFTSTHVEQVGGQNYQVAGKLTLHGVTREVVLEMEGPTPEIKDPWGNVRAAFTAKTSIDRKDFGLTWNQVLETGGVMVGDRVDIEADIEAVKQVEAQVA